MGSLITWIVSAAIGLAITWAIIYTAVRAALQAHYKTVRWYEATGEWLPGTTSLRHPPKTIGTK